VLHEDLRRVVEQLGLEIPTLERAAGFSARNLRIAELLLQNARTDDEDAFDVAVLGSLARMEATGRSDFDFLLVAHKLPSDPRASRHLLRSVHEVREELGLGAPGATGIFGSVASAADLTERIGLEADTNKTHSRRILLLEESRSIYRKDLHEELVRRIVERYLLDAEQRDPPIARFLLNDVLRYWRTLTVDYEAKRWEGLEQAWGLRYLKLRISRKIAFAGTLASIFLCDDPSPDYFVREFSKPPLARLARVCAHLDGSGRVALGTVIEIAESFTNRLGDRRFRESAKQIHTREELAASPEVAPLRENARRLQQALEKIFFDSDTFGPLSRRYLSF